MLVLVSGRSATGKTYIAERLSRETDMRVIAKDTLKEAMFGSRPEWQLVFGWFYLEHQSKRKLMQDVGQALLTGESVIAEADFDGWYRHALPPVIPEGTTIREIHCHADDGVVMERFAARAKSGIRHPGHGDRFWGLPMLIETGLECIGFKLKGPLGISEVLAVDTTDFKAIDWQKINDFIAT